jgi:hypothetical protein
MYHGETMTSAIQLGTILIKDRTLVAERLGLEVDSFSGTWNTVRALNGFALDRKVRAAGWNSLFMAAEVRGIALGPIRPNSLRAALSRIFSKVHAEDFNCLEVTAITARRFLGIPYVSMCAHSRHIQKGMRLDAAQARRMGQVPAAMAKS